MLANGINPGLYTPLCVIIGQAQKALHPSPHTFFPLAKGPRRTAKMGNSPDFFLVYYVDIGTLKLKQLQFA